MVPRLLAAKFDRRGQRLHNSLIEFDNFLLLAQQAFLLALHRAAQPFARLEQLDHRLYPSSDDIGDHRFSNHVHDPPGHMPPSAPHLRTQP